MIKCKIFSGVPLYLEKEINDFFKKNIELVNVVQSYNIAVNGSGSLIITIFYKEI